MRTTERAPERTTALFGGPPRCLLLGTPFMDRVLSPERGPVPATEYELRKICLPRTPVNSLREPIHTGQEVVVKGAPFLLPATFMTGSRKPQNGVCRIHEDTGGENPLDAVQSSGSTALVVPSTFPEALLACTATYGSPVRTATVVSKPRRGADPTGLRWLGVEPASTCQLSTSVAPFQLT